MDKDFLRLEAERLKKDPVFLKAIADIRSEALEALAKADASDMVTITSLQATARVCDGIASKMEAMINGAQPRRPQRAI